MANWAMWPKSSEQEMILHMELPALSAGLIESDDGSGGLIIAAVYDLIYAVNDEIRARQLLREALQTLTREHLADEAGKQIAFRIHWDRQPTENQQKFRDLVQTWLGVTVEAPELTPRQSLSAGLYGITHNRLNKQG